MSQNGASRFSGPLRPIEPQFDYDSSQRSVERSDNSKELSFFHGEALARDAWGERYGNWIVLGFTITFACFLLGMLLAGQQPGKSFLLKSMSDILQFVGEGIGFIFCLRMAIRLRVVSVQLSQNVQQLQFEHRSRNDLVTARMEAQVAQRSYLAWTLLALGIALYAGGQALWTSYDIRMNMVPFPGLYDIGFVGSYPFFLLGTLLLTRRNKATVGRTRLLLDALAVIGASLALSWFFLLGPSIAGLSQAPSLGAAFLSIYFPAGDLFLVAVGALLMFSPLSNREQQPVFLRLCLGLFFLAITDSLLGYYSLSFSFNTGTLQDVLWPLSLSLIGLAAIEYPRSIAREQLQAVNMNSGRRSVSLFPKSDHFSQLSTTVQTISPFILALITCAILLSVVAPRGKSVLIQADVIALVLILIVVVRQALTLMENNRLTMQMRGELVISRRELQVTRREADEATKASNEKRVLEEGIATLHGVHARVARGDLSARAPTIPGPLLPIAVSLNLMLDRLSALSERGAKYDQFTQESHVLQIAVERLGRGLPLWSANQPAPQSATELRLVFLGLTQLQHFHEMQWHRQNFALAAMNSLTRRLRETLNELKRSHLFKDTGQANFERMALERALREVDLLEQQQRNMLSHTALMSTPSEEPTAVVDATEQPTQQSKPLHVSAHGQAPFKRG
ncbi:MAG: hypothetical protein JO125_04115 [Chloroflexi bacterium]|nr:hypothetical protein [Chloroflexota bacterium]